LFRSLLACVWGHFLSFFVPFIPPSPIFHRFTPPMDPSEDADESEEHPRSTHKGQTILSRRLAYSALGNFRQFIHSHSDNPLHTPSRASHGRRSFPSCVIDSTSSVRQPPSRSKRRILIAPRASCGVFAFSPLPE
jgi:hypothetical protein